jgi:hypothetical protein
MSWDEARPAFGLCSRLRAMATAVLQQSATFVACAASVWRTLGAELTRLNHAGFDAEELNRHSRRERAHMIKDALAQRHEGINHCC